MTRTLLRRALTCVCCAAPLMVAGPAVCAPQDQASVSRPAVVIEVPPPEALQELVLQDGSVIFGRVQSVHGDRFVFQTHAGTVLECERHQVRSLRAVRGRIIRGQHYPEDPNPTRLFFGPTGRSLPRGTGYLGVYEIVLPFVQVGVTDRISVGAGTPLTFGGGASHPFWVTPKVQILSRPSTQAAVGVMHFLNVGDGHFGVAYGAVTQGSTDTAVTLGAGYVYERSAGDEVNGAAMWMIGGEHRVTHRVKLITENYVFSGGGLASFGCRFMGEHLSADLGLVMPLGVNETILFPVVNFVYQFN